MTRAKKNQDKILVEFIPYGGRDIGNNQTLRFKEFRRHFKNNYKDIKGSTFGKATDTFKRVENVKGWGIFVPRQKR